MQDKVAICEWAHNHRLNLVKGDAEMQLDLDLNAPKMILFFSTHSTFWSTGSTINEKLYTALSVITIKRGSYKGNCLPPKREEKKEALPRRAATCLNVILNRD